MKTGKALFLSGIAGLALLSAGAQAGDLKTQQLQVKPQLQQQLKAKPQVVKPKAVKPQQVKPGIAKPGAAKPGTTKPGELVPRGTLKVACPDPAIADFRIGRITSRPDAYGHPVYSISLVATLKNVGGAAYVTRPNQQSVAITEQSGQRRDVLYQPFGNLTVGQQRLYQVQLDNWKRSNEFPMSYVAQIRYDPDITKDGNPQNDDCRGSNNRRVVTGAQINAAIDALPRLRGTSEMAP